MSDTLKKYALTMPEAREAIIACIKARLVPLLKGSPGIGKSSLIHSIAREYGLKVIDLRLTNCDPTDLGGFPTIDKETGKAFYAPMDTFPLETDEVPAGYNGWILFLDEFTSCPRAVQAASYKVVLDRMIGLHKLHPKVAIVCAGNLETDNAIVEEMGTAMQSRLIHLQLMSDLDAWLEWAAKEKIDPRITSFVRWQPKLLNAFNPEHSDVTFACERTWEFLSNLLVKGGVKTLRHDRVTEALLNGTVSEGVMKEFLLYCELWKSLLTIDEIKRNPTGVNIPDEPSILWAVCGSVAQHIEEKNANAVMEFVYRLPVEFQIFTMKDVVRRKPELQTNPAVQKWVADFSDIF